MDEPLITSSGGVAVVGVGAILPGYVLACPSPHVMSLAELDKKQANEFAKLFSHAADSLTDAFGGVVIFEHGGCGDDVSKSQCVAHAHLHLWAISDRLSIEVPGETTSYESLAEFFDDSERWRGAPYLLGGSPQRFSVAADAGIPQYFRRQIASKLGHPDEWDYAAFWFEENMRSTIREMRGPQ